jgi:hypothetical protein
MVAGTVDPVGAQVAMADAVKPPEKSDCAGAEVVPHDCPLCVLEEIV